MDGSNDLSADASGIRPSDEMEEIVGQEDLDTSNSIVSAHQLEKLPEKSIIAEKIASEKPTRTSPRRPVTRSLSGRPAKRPIREDNAIDSSNVSADESDSRLAEYTPASKKPKLTPAIRKKNSRKSTAASESTLDSQAPATSASTSHSPPPVTGSSTYVFHSDPPSSAAPGQNPPIATRIGTTRAMRATLPIPVPNLTKKSRGRRVPVRVVTTTGDEIITNPAPVASDTGNGDIVKDKRSYVCSVEGCGKCFHRGEHLKRHIRSIHTHEKPFKCTYPECDKNFNRHDNLLQHLKVHKQAQATAAMTSRSPVVLLPNGKAKSKRKSKGSKGPAGKGRKKKRRSSSEDDDEEEEGESEAEQDDSDSSASSEDDDVDEASAVSNLLSLRANPPLKGSATLIAPLHHNLTSSYHTLSSSGSMSSTATLIGSSSGWGYPATSSFSFSPNASLPGSKPLYHPSFSSSFADSYPRKPYVSPSPSHSSFSLSKAYSSGPTTYESSAAAAGGTDVDVLYNGHSHVHDMMSDMRNTRIQDNLDLEKSNLGMGMGIDSKRNNGQDDSGRLMFQSNMAMSSLRSTSSALRSTNGQNTGKTVIDMDIGRPFDRDSNSNDVDPSGNGVNGHTKDAAMGFDVSNRDMTSGGGTNVRSAFHPGNTTTTTRSDFTNSATVDIAGPSGPKGFSGSATTKVGNLLIRPDSESAASSGPGPELSLQQRQGTDDVDQPMSSRMMLRPVGSEQDWKL